MAADMAVMKGTGRGPGARKEEEDICTRALAERLKGAVHGLVNSVNRPRNSGTPLVNRKMET